MSEYYSGRVSHVTYSDTSQNFFIFKMKMDTTGKTETVRGTVSGIQVVPGVWFGLDAKSVRHPKFGSQLEIVRAPVWKDGWDAETICNMLVASGVGRALVTQLRSVAGDDRLKYVLDDIALLRAQMLFTETQVNYIYDRWVSTKVRFQTLTFLADLGVPPHLVDSVYRVLGGDTEEILSKNPWALVEIEGISFSEADTIAQKMGIEDPRLRLRGAIIFSVRESRGFGHMYTPVVELLSGCQVLLGGVEIDPRFLGGILVDLHREGKIVVDRKTVPGWNAVYHPFFYDTEVQGAAMLLQRLKSAAFVEGSEGTRHYLWSLGSVGPETQSVAQAGQGLEDVVSAAVQEWQSQSNLTLSPDQRKGVENALSAPVSILAGLPGSGKTTSLKAAVRILQDASIPFLLLAPTGIAAKNLSSRTGAPASTVHRGFHAKGIEDSSSRERNYHGVVGDATGNLSTGEELTWDYSPSNPHPADVVIVDESSMLDAHLLYRILFCTKPTTRLVFVGDAAQLPSVGPGNVLRDILDSGLFSSVRLEQIYRQENTSGIVVAAHSVFRGQVPHTRGADFQLEPLASDEAVADRVVALAEQYYEDRIQFQVLSPKHGGKVGVTALNARLRELLNPAAPHKQEVRIGYLEMREGDRVMVLKNNYQLGIYNGDVGKIDRIDKVKQEVHLKIFGDPPVDVALPFADAKGLLGLAYAVTVHKSQGLEYDRVIMPLVMGFRHQLQRNLLYTAVTRAKERVVLIGQHSALAQAVANSKQDARYTLFPQRIRGGAAEQESE